MARKKLMIPGPVDIPEGVRQAMAVPCEPHYGTDWVRFFGETQEMAKQVFETQNDLYILTGPGTMALEAAMASTLEDGDALLIPCSGFFSERLIAVAEGCGLRPISVEVPAGQPVLPHQIEDAFAAHADIKAVVLVHHETSCGVLNPLKDIAEVARVHNALMIVDAVSSLGGVPLPVDAWDIDICVTVTNKTLETPPALSLMSISPRAWDAVTRRKSHRGWYLDLKTWRWYAQNWSDWHPTPATMPTSNIHALHYSLQAFLEEGAVQRREAYLAASRAVRAGLRILGFPLFVEDAYASPLATAFCMRPGIAADDLQAWLVEHADVIVASGIGALHGHILRVGHIGLARKRDYVVAFLLGVEEYLRSCGVDVVPGMSLVALEGVEAS